MLYLQIIKEICHLFYIILFICFLSHIGCDCNSVLSIAWLCKRTLLVYDIENISFSFILTIGSVYYSIRSATRYHYKQNTSMVRASNSWLYQQSKPKINLSIYLSNDWSIGNIFLLEFIEILKCLKCHVICLFMSPSMCWVKRYILNVLMYVCMYVYHTFNPLFRWLEKRNSSPSTTCHGITVRWVFGQTTNRE